MLIMACPHWIRHLRSWSLPLSSSSHAQLGRAGTDCFLSASFQIPAPFGKCLRSSSRSLPKLMHLSLVVYNEEGPCLWSVLVEARHYLWTLVWFHPSTDCWRSRAPVSSAQPLESPLVAWTLKKIGDPSRAHLWVSLTQLSFWSRPISSSPSA